MEPTTSRKGKQSTKKSRFNFQPRKAKTSEALTKIDPRCQEATPELLRIEIDQIFKDFLDNPQATEYIFPADFNNLQRKYIHAKAQKINIISKSYGKEPNRHLHIKKRNQQLSNQSFILTPCELSTKYLNEFMNIPLSSKHQFNHYRARQTERVSGKLVNGPPIVPAGVNFSKEVSRIKTNLPIWDHRELIVNTIRNSQITILSSETGSGKTTQVPQYIMEDMSFSRRPCKIICTQPRRISTVGAAERVAFERGDPVGVSVGYHIRLEQKYGINTNLIYCTTGVFLRNLMSGEKGLLNITHIILDEIHERDKLSDFLLICLKQSLFAYPNLRVILMSATVNTKKFLDYFGSGKILSIPGRLFVIDTVFLEQILFLTKYVSPKMREAQRKEEKLKEKSKEHVIQDKPSCSSYTEENSCVDEAMDEYLNFSENYDYRIHYEEATAQLGMFFLSEGISVDYQHSKNGRTALMIAAYLGDKEFISRLCNMGANMDLCDNIGKSVFEYAEENPEILRLLQYIKRKRENNSENEDESNKEVEHLLQLYDKTTSDDFIDYELIVTLISFIHNSGQEGSILVFLPGYDDIMVCNDKVLAQLNPGTFQIFFLHGSMNIRDQHGVFKRLPVKRKIILSTNIAETSITIDDVVFVIDTGKAKEKCYDSYNKVSSLQTHWISQACAKQRMGRAGRTRPGMCFRLYSKQRYENMDEERVPEILRVSLEELCLHTKILAPDDMNIHDFLTMAPDAPSANSIKVAIENLQFLGALDKEEDLTRLGEFLAQLTTEPHLGKMLIVSVIFRCLDPILTLVASLTHKDPFQLPPQANLKTQAAEKRRQLLDGIMSDHMLYLQVFKKWQENCAIGKISQFCEEFYVSHPTMNSILETRSQLLGQLRAAGFISQSKSIDEYNRNANSWPVVKAIICTGLYPNLAYPLHQNLATRSEKKVNIQNSSSCFNKTITTWLIYDEMIKHRNVLLIRGVSAVTTMTVGLICGIDIINPSPSLISIDEWVEFDFPDQGPVYLRNALDQLIKNVLLNPAQFYTEYDYIVIDTLRKILDEEEKYVDLKIPRNIGERPRFFFPQNEFVTKRPVAKPNYYKRGVGQNTNFIQQSWRSPKQYNDGSERGPKQHNFAQYKRPSQLNGSYNSQYEGPVCSSIKNLKLSSRNPADKLLNGLYNEDFSRDVDSELVASNTALTSDKFGDFLDTNIYILIKPRQIQNVEIARQTSKWIFAPQTEKKIVHFSTLKKAVYLIYTVIHSHAFQGVAKYKHLFNEESGKPTASIQWIFRKDLPYSTVRHLKNPYNYNKPVYEGLDGQIVKQSIAEELIRIYQESSGLNKPSSSHSQY